jgi:hypothetical protein
MTIEHVGARLPLHNPQEIGGVLENAPFVCAQSSFGQELGDAPEGEVEPAQDAKIFRARAFFIGETERQVAASALELATKRRHCMHEGRSVERAMQCTELRHDDFQGVVRIELVDIVCCGHRNSLQGGETGETCLVTLGTISRAAGKAILEGAEGTRVEET